MADQETHVVTGAFGFSGRYIAQRLLDAGHSVRTLTTSLNRPNPFGERVKAFPMSFDSPDALARTLQGASVLYNTYWVRFNEHGFDQSVAVENTRRLIHAARQAGVRRMVHVSITNPSHTSPFPYFRGKAELEDAVLGSGMSYAILRPAVLFGPGGILINNIAWMLRRFPVFGVFGDGSYRLQPIYVDDLAKLAIAQGAKSSNVIIDAIGPETFTYRQLVQTIAEGIGKPRPILSIPDWLGYFLGWAMGKLVNDVIITRQEIEGLKAEVLFTPSPPAGETKLSEWVRANASTLGKSYDSELARRRNRTLRY